MNNVERMKRIAGAWNLGLLPKEPPVRSWGGPSPSEHGCLACGALIGKGDTEIEAQYQADQNLTFHAACFTLLQALRQTHPA